MDEDKGLLKFVRDSFARAAVEAPIPDLRRDRDGWYRSGDYQKCFEVVAVNSDKSRLQVSPVSGDVGHQLVVSTKLIKVGKQAGNVPKVSESLEQVLG